MHQNRIIIPVFLMIFLICAPVAAEENKSALEWYDDAIDLATAGEYEDALVSVDNAIVQNSNLTIAYVAKSGILNAMGRYEEALAVADFAIDRRPDMPEAWVNRASAEINLGLYEDALASAETATTLAPDNVEGWIVKGTALGCMGRYEDELAASEKALLISPNDQRAIDNRAYAIARIEEHEAETQAETPLSPFICAFAPAAAAYLICRRFRC